jgi:hypothetical protein
MHSLSLWPARKQKNGISYNILFHGATAPSGPGPPHYQSFTITLGRTPPDEWSARRRDLYLTTDNIHNRKTSMPTEEFEPEIPVSERPQTYALDCAATEIGIRVQYIAKAKNFPQTLIQKLNFQIQRKLYNPTPHNNTTHKPRNGQCFHISSPLIH